LRSVKDRQLHFVGRPKDVPNKSKMADGRHLEKNKLLYLSNRLTHFDEILHGDAHWFSKP